MSMLQAQDAIVAQLDALLKAELPDLVVVFYNQPFNHANPPDLYAEVEVDFQGSQKVGLGTLSSTRYRGHVYVDVHSREGSGSRRAREVVDWFASKLEFSKLGPVQFEEPLPDGNRDGKGWVSLGLKLPFFTDPM